jgi:hypothetical protein
MVMRVVLYTDDFEPITVLDLPLWLLEQLERQGQVRVAVLRPPQFAMNTGNIPVGSVEGPDVVTIYCEKLRWKDGTTKPILVTYDEELALALRPDWLPGQTQAVQGYQAALRHLTNQLIKAMRK